MKVAVIYYSTYGHIETLAKRIQSTAEFEVDLFQIKETLPTEVLSKMYAPPKSDIPNISVDQLKNYDAFLFGIPTRFGNLPGQWKSFWDSTGSLWASGELYGKPFGIFVSTAGYGAQESTIRSSLSSFIHHGMVYIPLGYGEAFPLLTDLNEVHGGSPWGAGSFAGADGSRQPTELELKILDVQVKSFGNLAKKFVTNGSESEVKKEVAASKTPVAAAKTAEKRVARDNQSTPAVKEDDSFCSKCIIM